MESRSYTSFAFVAFFCFLGFSTTFYLISLGLNPILSSSLIGLAGGVLPSNHFFGHKKVMEVLYCASFAAIGADNLLHSSYILAVLPLLILFIFVLTQNHFKGFGGKLGSIAFLATCIFGSVLSLLF